MKLSKQEFAIIGVLILVFIGIIVYSVAVFGGKKDKNVRNEFEAPEITRNEAKNDYNARMLKELREEPEKPKEPDEALLANPFEEEKEPLTKRDSQLMDSTALFASLYAPEKENEEQPPKHDVIQETKIVPKPKQEPKQMVRPLKKKAEPVRIQEEPEEAEPMPEPEEKPVQMLITKRRYSQLEKKGLNSINPNLKASVYGQQKIYNNSLLKMRLLSQLKLSDEVVIPRNTFIYAVARFSNERVLLNVKNITYRNIIYPVDYTICDANDGMEGIFVGGDVLNELADETNTTLASEAVSSTGIRALNSIGNEVKSWTKKKSVTILNEHNLYLK